MQTGSGHFVFFAFVPFIFYQAKRQKRERENTKINYFELSLGFRIFPFANVEAGNDHSRLPYNGQQYCPSRATHLVHIYFWYRVT